MNFGNKPPLFSSENFVSLLESLCLSKEELFIYPTETFYALGCRINSLSAIQKIYQVKKRSRKVPFLVLVNSWEMFQEYIPYLDKNVQLFLQHVWPAPLTGIFHTEHPTRHFVNPDGDSIAIRMTPNLITCQLLEYYREPLIGTSANISTEAPYNTISRPFEIFSEYIDFGIDGGPLPGNKPSTILNFKRTDSWEIIRQGEYSKATMENILSELCLSIRLH